MKPILFNTEMVRAILDGRKRVTRRVVKPQPRAIYHDGTIYYYDKDYRPIIIVEGQNGFCKQIVSPYRPGGILYVRETWQYKRGGGYLYKADFMNSLDLWVTPDGRVQSTIPWHPSIHMPKKAARLFLRVTGVRVERLQEITEEQAQREGFYHGWSKTETSTPAISAKQAFRWYWNDTIKKVDIPLYGLAANPWVWVIEFERISKEEAFANARDNDGS